MNYTNTTGYTSGSSTEGNGINIIPSSKITMKNVNKALTLIPVINGKPQHDKKRIARPGDDDIDFGPEVTSVIEIPLAQMDWGLVGDTLDKSNIKNNPFSFNTAQHTYGSFGTNQGVKKFVGPENNTWDTNANTTPDLLEPSTKNFIGPENNTWDTNLNKIPDLLENKGDNPSSGAPTETETSGRNVKFLTGINPYGTRDLGTSMYTSGMGFGLSKYGATSGQKAWGTTLGIASAAQGILGSARNFFSGFGEAKRYGQEEAEMRRKRLEAMQNEGVYDSNVAVPGEGQTLGYKKGGFVDFLKKGGYSSMKEENTEKREVNPKMLTGNFLEGNANHPNPNAELESGEYIRTPEGESMEIVGKKHSEGGELLDLPVNTKVVSDYLKIGASNAKSFQKEFNVKVSAGSTFATVVDKYRKTIGLTDILAEEEEIIKKIAEQEQITNQVTKDLNYKVLSKRLNTIQEQKAPLEEKLTDFVDFVFDVQENHKEEKGISSDNTNKQNGGTQEEELILAYAEQQGVDPQEVIAELESLSEEEQQVMLTEIMSSFRNNQPSNEEGEEEQEEMSPEDIIEDFAELQGIDPQEIINSLEELSPEEQQQAFQEMAAAVAGSDEETEEGVSPEAVIEAFAQQQGIDPQEIISELESLDGEEQQAMFAQMVEAVGGMEETPEMRSGGVLGYQAGGSVDDFDTKYASYTGFGNYAADDIEAKRIAAQKYIEQYDPTTSGKIDYSNKSQEELDQMVSAIRKRKIKDLPQTSVYFGKNVIADRAGLQFMLNNKMLSPETLKNYGVQLSKDGSIKRGTFDTLSEEQKTKLKAKIDETLALPQNKDLAEEYAIQTYDDGIWDRREFMVEPKAFKTAEDRDKWLKEKGYKETDKGVYATDKEGLFVRPIISEGSPAPAGTPAPGPDNSQSPFRKLQKDDDGFLMLPPQLPSRENLPPNLLMPTLRQTRAFQSDPLAISPNSTIRETARSVRSQQRMLEDLDPSLAAANSGNLVAEEATANANAIEKANLANQADRRQVDSLNEDRLKNTLDTNLNLQANYEQLAQTALQNFYDENRNYITKRNNDNIENWNLVNKINAYNAANPNYKFTSSGAIVQVGRPFFYTDGMPVGENDEIEKDPKTGKTYAKRNGKKEEIFANENKPGLTPELTPEVRKQSGGKISFSDYLKKLK